MHPDVESPATGATIGGTASEAALIATFYGRRKAEDPREEAPAQVLHKELYRWLAAEPEATDVPTNPWHNPKDGTILSRLDPVAAPDTTAIRLALNAPGDAADAWKTMRQKLEKALNATTLNGNWGYTLVYQAVLNRGVYPDLAFSKLLPDVWRLRSDEPLHKLAQAYVSGGWVWLLDVPLQGEGLDAATVYVALSPPDREDAFMKALFGRPNAMLFMPELIAHKGYHQVRQHRGGNLQHLYKTSVESLRGTTERLLGDLGRQETGGLDELARKYNLLVPVASEMKGLHVSLIRQSHNYDRWRARIKSNDITEYHRDRLETGTLELELKVEELQHALETADKAVSLAQVKVNETQERRQLRIEALLAAAGVALALPHLLDYEATLAWLTWVHGLLSGLLGLDVSDTEFGRLTVFWVQIAVILPIAVLAYFLVKGSLHTRRGPSKRV